MTSIYNSHDSMNLKADDCRGCNGGFKTEAPEAPSDKHEGIEGI